MKKLGNLPARKRVNRSRLPIQNAKKLPKRPKNSVFDSISNKKILQNSTKIRKNSIIKKLDNFITSSWWPNQQINKQAKIKLVNYIYSGNEFDLQFQYFAQKIGRKKESSQSQTMTHSLVHLRLMFEQSLFRSNPKRSKVTPAGQFWSKSATQFGHLHDPVTETSTNLATVTMETRASKTMLKIILFSGHLVSDWSLSENWSLSDYLL